MASQGLLFSEPSIAETGVWCNLSEGIDPAEWAMLCRHIGTLNPEEFEQVQNEIMPDPDVAKSNLNRLFHRTDILIDIPLVSLGPSGIGGGVSKRIYLTYPIDKNRIIKKSLTFFILNYLILY